LAGEELQRTRKIIKDSLQNRPRELAQQPVSTAK
jgi:hypothetical protein